MDTGPPRLTESRGLVCTCERGSAVNREAEKDDSTKLCVCRIFYLLGVMQSLEQTQVLQNNPVLKMSDLSVS